MGEKSRHFEGRLRKMIIQENNNSRFYVKNYDLLSHGVLNKYQYQAWIPLVEQASNSPESSWLPYHSHAIVIPVSISCLAIQNDLT